MVNKFQKGFMPVLVILLVFASSVLLIAVVFKVIPRIKAQLTGQPQGKLVATPSAASSLNGSITFTAEDVVGVSAAQIDYVRYYLLSPNLAVGNSWGNPNWCGGVEPCTQATDTEIKTYDFGESSNPSNDYAVVWDSTTKSPDSQGTDRSLTPQNIPDGTYTIALKIRDVEGNENGSASTVTITIDSSQAGGKVQASPLFTTSKGSVAFTALNVKGNNGAAVDNVRYYLVNPKLARWHQWLNPDWCASANPCVWQPQGLYTYDIGQSSNPNNNYRIDWNSKTKSSGSTAYSRALSARNILPGIYQVGLRVQDVNGNVVGGASELYVTIKACYDFNGDNNVNQTDLNIAASKFGQTGQALEWDVNYDGRVNSIDLSLISKNFGFCRS